MTQIRFFMWTEINAALATFRILTDVREPLEGEKNLSLIDNVMFPALVSKSADKNKVYKRAKQLFEMTGIASLENNNINQASGGQLQRVAICRALINEPDIIFGDEPTGALDSKSATEIMSLLNEINKKGTTIMLVTHDAKVAAKTEKILYMVDGEIVVQKKMNKYDPQIDDIKEREESILKWLVESADKFNNKDRFEVAEEKSIKFT